MPTRIEPNIERTLQMLADANVHAAFFTLGWVAERFPAVIRRIGEQGHERAGQRYAHDRATALDSAEFLADIRLAKAVLEDIAAAPVHGYRAPSFSIGDSNRWAYDCLAEAGYRYSSSIYPIRHDHYGSPSAPRFAHEAANGLLEIPVTTARLLARNWPAGGGGYFRLMPYVASRWLIRRVNTRDRQSAVFYFHPWEIDPDQPRVGKASAKARFRHYVNLRRMSQRLELLFADFRWDRLDRIAFGRS
jgi:polysaccharide deacetylase family protein (PEP-CTERM system associated)